MWWRAEGSGFALEAGEFGVGFEPGFPAGEEFFALALASKDAMEVAAVDSEFLGSD